MSKSENRPAGDIPVYHISKHDFIISIKNKPEKRDDSWIVDDLLSVNDYPPEAEANSEPLDFPLYIDCKVTPDDIPF
jgi:hypothetical protein